MSTAARLLPWVLGLVLLVSCGSNDGKTPKHRLEGSLSAIMDLGYDEVRVLPSVEDVAVLFVRIHPFTTFGPDGGEGTNEDYPFKVTVKLWGNPLFGHVRVNLAELDATKKEQRGIFSRNVLNDPRREFPKAEVSTLYLDQVPEVGLKMTGDFNVTFQSGIEGANGRTVFGTFDAKVVQ